MRYTIGILLNILIIAAYILWMRYIRNKQGVGAKMQGGVQIFDIVVKGVYRPDVIEAEAGKPVQIRFLRRESTECSRFVKFPDFRIRKELPEGKTVVIELTPEKKANIFSPVIWECIKDD